MKLPWPLAVRRVLARLQRSPAAPVAALSCGSAGAGDRGAKERRQNDPLAPIADNPVARPEGLQVGCQAHGPRAQRSWPNNKDIMNELAFPPESGPALPRARPAAKAPCAAAAAAAPLPGLLRRADET